MVEYCTFELKHVFDEDSMYDTSGMAFRDYIALNRVDSWREFVIENVKRDDGYDCNTVLGGRLLKSCQEHLGRHKRQVESDNVLMLTHPLFCGIEGMCIFENRIVQGDLKSYHDKLFELLESRKRDKLGVVVLENFNHYAKSTSFLLEKGWVDDVIFTEDVYGTPLDSNDFAPYVGRNIFFGGGYDGRCLLSSICAFDEYNRSSDNDPSSIYGVQDLVLVAPGTYDFSLRVNERINGIEDDQVISLKKMNSMVEQIAA